MALPAVRREDSPIERISQINDARYSSLASLQEKCVNIWIWTKEAAQRSVVYYGHVALEVNTGGQTNRKIYISFWERCMVDNHASLYGNRPHFHHNKDEDDFCENARKIENNANLETKSYSYTLYTLDIDKIEKAFVHFTDNYQSLSKLRVGWFRTYSLTNVGLAAYLLEMGGIDKLYDRGDQTPGFVKICLGVGVIFAAYSFYSATRLRRLGESFSIENGSSEALWRELNSIYMQGDWLVFQLKLSSYKTLNATETTLQKIIQAANSISSKIHGIESAKEIRDKALNIVKSAKNIVDVPVLQIPDLPKSKKPDPSDVAKTASETISAIGREILYSLAAISAYYALRIYLTGAIASAQDIAVIARKSTKKEARERYKKAYRAEIHYIPHKHHASINTEIEDFLNRLDRLSSTSERGDTQKLMEELAKIWSQLSDAGLDDFFLKLVGRIQDLSTQKRIPHNRVEGQRLFGTFNQFSPRRRDGTEWPSEASRSSCTVNALTFLSYALAIQTMQEWYDRASSEKPEANIINEIIDEGRARFENILKNRREELQTVIRASSSNEGKHQADLLRMEIGGDALHVREVPRVEEFFFLTPHLGGETLPLIADSHSDLTIGQFIQLLEKWTPLASERSIGIILQYNGYSHGLVLLKQVDGLEYAVFDSHGSQKLNESSSAFVYFTKELNQAAEFLGNLVKKQELSEILPSKESKFEQNKMAIYMFRSRFGST
jgi:hypothetical protein